MKGLITKIHFKLFLTQIYKNIFQTFFFLEIPTLRHLRSSASRRRTTSAAAPPASTPRRSQASPLDPQPDPELNAVLGDDLSARFAKLRTSLSQSSAASIPGSGPTTSMVSFDEDEEEDEDDEVEKLIR